MPWSFPGRIARHGRAVTRVVSMAVTATMVLAVGPRAAFAAPANVGAMTYDESQRRITIGLSGTVSVRTQRIKNPDRLVIDLSEARLPLGQPTPIIQPKNSRIRSIRMGQHSYVPPVVRVVVDLMPGFEPMVTVNQAGGNLLVTLANPKPPQGERELESLPIVPLPAESPTPVPGMPITSRPAPIAPPAALPNPSTQPPVLTPPIAFPDGPTPRPTPTPLPPPPVPAWTPPPIPAWANQPTPTPMPTPTPVTDPFSMPPWGFPAEPAPTASESPEPAEEASQAETVVAEERRYSNPFGSSFQLRWQQIETLEEYGAAEPSFAYPAGINGFDFEHWFLPYLGAGLDARILYYDLSVESVRQHRTDASMGTYLAVRYPLFGILEPSLRAGYMGRSVTVESENTGTTFPFSPLQTYYGPTLSGRLKVAILPGFGLELHGKLLPSTQGALYPGFPTVHPLSGRGWGALLVTDLWGGYVSMGYVTERLENLEASFRQTFSGITMGMGFRY